MRHTLLAQLVLLVLVGLAWPLALAAAGVEAGPGWSIGWLAALVALLAASGATIAAARRADTQLAAKTAEIERLSAQVAALSAELNEARGVSGGANQAELLQARSEAEAYRRSESAKSELISIVSHELRTPLTALQGFSELLLVRSSTEEERRLWTTTINEEAKRLAKILDDLLNVSRIEGGTLRLSIRPVPIDDVIQQVLPSFEGDDARHHFVVDPAPSGLEISADRERLMQILDSLVSNAVKYSPAGGEVRVAVREDGGEAVISVTDQGLGISGVELPKLFSRFHRIDTPDRVSIRGTGLGLYLAQKLVAMHGGTMSVTSRLGEGSTFTFTMPLVRAERAAMTGAR
jgi:signal transduction histidine kinase